MMMTMMRKKISCISASISCARSSRSRPAPSNHNDTGGFANFDPVPRTVAPPPANNGGFAWTRYRQRHLSFA
jgi:hypothetical protein